MKDKLVKILNVVIISICFLCIVYAETTTISCIPDPNGIVKIKWNGNRDKVGEVYTCHYPITIETIPVTDGEHYHTEEEADEACKNQPEIDLWRKPACCDIEDPKSSCKGSAACKEPECIKEKHCPSITGATTIYITEKYHTSADTAPYDTSYGSTILTISEGSSVKWSGGSYTTVSGSGKSATVKAKSAGTDTICAETEDAKVCVQIKVSVNKVYDPIDKPGNNNTTNTTKTSPFRVNLERANLFTVESNVLSEGSSSEKTECYYTWHYDKTEAHRISDKCEPSSADVYSYSYELDTGNVTSSGDPVYCLQPGATGPGVAGLEYVLDSSFDLSSCVSPFKNKNDQNRVECGLAQILFQTVRPADSTGATYTTEIGGETVTGTATSYVSNGKYNNATITLALRLWMAHYGKTQYGLKLGESSENSILDWIPKENFYEVTAKAITGGKTYDTSWKSDLSNQRNLIVCRKGETPGQCDIDKAIELFHNAERAGSDADHPYLGGISFVKEVPVITHTEYGSNHASNIDDAIPTGETIIELPETFETLEIECTDEEIKNGTCEKIKVQYFYTDSSGQLVDVTDLVVTGGFCNKRLCKIKTTGTKLCDIITSGRIRSVLTIRVTIKGWSRSNGWIRFYTAAKNPQKYQKMISFAFNLEKCETKNKEKESKDYIETTTRIECPCSPDDKCNNLTPIEHLSANCNNPADPDYTVSTIEGPKMSCIMNACNPSEKETYNYNIRYKINDRVCNIYCKDDVTFYMPNKTKVYSGMQFSYDLGNVLKSKGILKNTVSDQKLTSVVIVERQCTSQIKYAAWKEEFNKKMDIVKLTYESKNTNAYNAAIKEVSQWLYELQNCNFYSKNDLVDPYSSISMPEYGTTKEYALSRPLCEGTNECPALTVTYEDSEYGKTPKIAKKTVAIQDADKNKTYYCSGNNCYKYDKNNPTEISGSNRTEILKYLICSGGSCNYRNVTVPSNDYASFRMIAESDYYQAQDYKAQAYTGKVKDGSVDVNDTSWTPLPSNSYPVSNYNPTGSYNINYSYKLRANQRDKAYNYTCKYDAYNTTVLYDCNYKNEDGSIDLTKCKNSCFEMKDGIPVIKDNCTNWDKTDSKNYGFIFRNVELNDLFPDAEISEQNGISTRDPGTNWVGYGEERQQHINIINDIKASADIIFTNDKYLDYRYVLTPEAIKMIKEYNEQERNNGGYLNATLIKCELTINKDSGLYQFSDCKSSFLNELKNSAYERVGVQVSGSKTISN